MTNLDNDEGSNMQVASPRAATLAAVGRLCPSLEYPALSPLLLQGMAITKSEGDRVNRVRLQHGGWTERAELNPLSICVFVD